MRIEIIAIGSELLNGQTINSNATFLSHKLQENGYQSYRHLAIADDPSSLSKELSASFDMSDIVICSGGLGPTLDDLTKDTVANLLELKIVSDDLIKEDLKLRFPNYAAAERDALVLKEAIVLPNKVGTAPGFIIEKNSKVLILLPGVPSELRSMFNEAVIPYLKQKFPVTQSIYQRKIGLFLIFETNVNPILEKFKKQYPKLEVGIYPSIGYVIVSVMKVLSTNDSSHEEVDKIIEEIKLTFPENVFEKSIHLDLHNELIAKKLKVAFAESCTGGSIAAAMTKIPDASKYFKGSIVAYSNEMKIKLLHVNKNTLNDKGAVSSEVVSEMLDGLLNVTDADYALATSGIAGPGGGTAEKPVGTVCIGWASKAGKKEIGFIYSQGDREKVIEQTVTTALAMLLKKIKYNADTFKNG